MSFWGRSWWVIAFCIVTGLGYLHFMEEKKQDLNLLSQRLQEMQNAKNRALEIKEELQLRIASQNDPAWIEMILIRDLGVVPEGFLKVHFKK